MFLDAGKTTGVNGFLFSLISGSSVLGTLGGILGMARPYNLAAGNNDG